MSTHTRTAPLRGVLVAFAIGSLVCVGLGVYGRMHEPTFFAINLAGFSAASPRRLGSRPVRSCWHWCSWARRW
jgi:hypothetical protein